jgi:hypothetical protein
MTKVAWEKKRDEIRKVIPNAKKETVVFNLKRGQSTRTADECEEERRRRERHLRQER